MAQEALHSSGTDTTAALAVLEPPMVMLLTAGYRRSEVNGEQFLAGKRGHTS